MCNKTVKCCNKKVHIKRFFLPLILSWLSLFYDELRTYIYMPLIISFGCIFLFWNFPILVYFTNSKPLYYEDVWVINHNLSRNDIVPEKIRNRINCIFLWILIFTNSILIGALSDYWMFKAQDKHTLTELVGVSGGILKIFQIVNDSSAKVLIMIMRKYVRENSDTFHIMDISPNKKDMSPNFRVIEVKKRTTFNNDEKKSIEMKNMNDKDLNENKDIKINI